jgi:hypothetical protein
MDTDPACLRCGCSFHPGLSQKTLASVMGSLSAITMGVFVNMSGVLRPDEWVASVFVYGIFMGVAGLAGTAFGWVLGAFVCEV